MLGTIILWRASASRGWSVNRSSIEWSSHSVEANIRRVGAEFLSVDLDTALTFIAVARSADDSSEKKVRNQRNARKAYDKVQKLLAPLDLPSDQQSEITEKLSRLRAELEALGECF